MKKPDEIITDADIERVHGYANFGLEMTKRQVVDSGVLQYAFGYSTGYTMLTILLEHKLLTKPKPGSYKARLSDKGILYLKSLFADVSLKQIMGLRVAE